MNLSSITLQDIVNWGIVILGILSVVVEFIEKCPIHIWSPLISWVGKSLNKDIKEHLKELEERQKESGKAIEELKEHVDLRFRENERSQDEKEAKRLRASIISFADSCRVNNHHTQEHFKNVFRDYDDYINYCEKHDIPNHYIDEQMDYIRDIYQRCLKENKFL